jgi:nicotinamidase-related amidase
MMSEQFYDDVIAPKLLEVMNLCREHGMPFVATVEYAPGEYGTSADLPAEEDRSLPMDWAYAAARSNGNGDALIMRMIRQAEKRGHGSVYMMQLGVPLTPSGKGE